MTPNGEDNHLVCPEGLPDYKVPPPSMAEPSPALPEGNESAEGSVREQRMMNGEKEVEMICNDEGSNDEYPKIEFVFDADVMFLCEL